MSVMEAGTQGARGDSEKLGDLGRLVADVMPEDEDRPFVRCEPPEAAIEKVSIGDAAELIRCGGIGNEEHVQIRDPLALPAGLGDADMRENAMEPRVEPVRIAEARQVTPGDHQ